jgi:MFS family permease
VKNRTTLLILGTAQFVMVLDSTVMNVSISQVVADLNTTVTDVQVAITLYTLTMAALMLIGAKFGDVWGRRRAFSIGLAVYGLGSLTTALAPTIGWLYLGWSVVEGLGAVLVIPSIAALTAANYEGKERAVAFAAIGGISGAAAAAGPLIGGFVTTALTWRVVFAAETVICILILLFGVRRIGDKSTPQKEKLDLIGALLSALGMGFTVFGILKISSWGFFRPTGAPEVNGHVIQPFGLSVVPFLIAAGVIVLGLFLRWEERLERRGRKPILRPDLLKLDQMRAGLSTLMAQYLILAGTFFTLPLYLQLVLGKDALQTGLKILPISVAMMVTAMLGPRLAGRSSPRRVVEIGMAILFVSVLMIMASINPELNSPFFFVAMAGFGAGIGLTFSQLGNVVMSSVGEERSNEAGGLQGVGQNLGQSLGTALIGAVLLAQLTSGFQQDVQASTAIPNRVKADIEQKSEGGIQMVALDDAEQIAKDAGLSGKAVDEVVSIYADSQIRALKAALLVASLFVLVGAWFARALPDKLLADGMRAPPEEAGAPVGA